MADTAPRPVDDGGPDFVDDVDRCGLRIELVPVARVGRLRSPMLDGLPPVAASLDEDAAAAMTLPLDGLIGPARVGLLVAGPLLLVVTWQVALAAGLLVVIVREAQRLSDRFGFTFGGGFLAYRPETGWPQGVQEDDDVRWRWTPAGDGRRPGPASTGRAGG